MKMQLYIATPSYGKSIGYKDKFDNKEFWDWVREKSKTNIILVSEYESPEDFECIWETGVNLQFGNNEIKTQFEKLFIYKGDKND